METRHKVVHADGPLNEALAHSGLRLTPQRQHVHSVLLGKLDHPTADQVFMRAKQTMPEISMATVYNCLDALVQCGLVRQVNHDRAATRYCPNMQDHAHFYCAECGEVFDIEPARSRPVAFPLPAGFKVTTIETSIRGVCPDCSGQKK